MGSISAAILIQDLLFFSHIFVSFHSHRGFRIKSSYILYNSGGPSEWISGFPPSEQHHQGIKDTL
jgi:hypothetical protein